MRYISFVLALTLLLAMAGTALAGDDVGRYQVVMTQVSERKGEISQIPVLVDTKTGRVWYMGSSLSWYPMFIFSEGARQHSEESSRQGGSYLPK